MRLQTTTMWPSASPSLGLTQTSVRRTNGRSSCAKDRENCVVCTAAALGSLLHAGDRYRRSRWVQWRLQARIRQWHAANLTCVNLPSPTFQYRAEVWECEMGAQMVKHVATLVIEPRSLVREGLVSLMSSLSYHVVGGIASMADLDSSLLAADVPKLVILGALPADETTIAASCIRELWPETKIILLIEPASSTDYQKWHASEIDGCIPLSVSPDVLIGTLQQILDGDLKILVHEAVSRSVTALPYARLPVAPVMTNAQARNGAFDSSFSLRVAHGLSEREEQVLRDLVKGLPNKMIARKRDIAEATVKVHLKSILRKIRMANRTQAAIWALGNGYGTEDLHPELPRLEATTLQPLEAPQ
jgi:two-component system nitrate/nitrite response regulator NarL